MRVREVPIKYDYLPQRRKGRPLTRILRLRHLHIPVRHKEKHKRFPVKKPPRSLRLGGENFLFSGFLEVNVAPPQQALFLVRPVGHELDKAGHVVAVDAA